MYFNGFLCVSWSFSDESSSLDINDEFMVKGVGTDLN